MREWKLLRGCDTYRCVLAYVCTYVDVDVYKDEKVIVYAYCVTCVGTRSCDRVRVRALNLACTSEYAVVGVGVCMSDRGRGCACIYDACVPFRAHMRVSVCECVCV